jgi:DNA-binding winged helix-turn-helix (wHTH) protein
VGKAAEHEIAFDAFHLDPVRRVLTRDGERLQMPPQLFDLLLYFLGNPQRTLAKDELRRTIWPDRTVGDGSLTQAVHTLRKALEDRRGGRRFIVTSPGRGYRFVCPVRGGRVADL